MHVQALIDWQNQSTIKFIHPWTQILSSGFLFLHWGLAVLSHSVIMVVLRTDCPFTSNGKIIPAGHAETWQFQFMRIAKSQTYICVRHAILRPDQTEHALQDKKCGALPFLLKTFLCSILDLVSAFCLSNSLQIWQVMWDLLLCN